MNVSVFLPSKIEPPSLLSLPPSSHSEWWDAGFEERSKPPWSQGWSPGPFCQGQIGEGMHLVTAEQNKCVSLKAQHASYDVEIWSRVLPTLIVRHCLCFAIVADCWVGRLLTTCSSQGLDDFLASVPLTPWDQMLRISMTSDLLLRWNNVCFVEPCSWHISMNDSHSPCNWRWGGTTSHCVSFWAHGHRLCAVGQVLCPHFFVDSVSWKLTFIASLK